MGRPREHNDSTAEALLDAAETLVTAEGAGALSVRAVAQLAGTTTRAIYSVFGGREDLLAALGARAFRLLEEGLHRHPVTADPAADLVAIGLQVFRQQLVVEHPVLFTLGIQQPPVDPASRAVVLAAAQRAWPSLLARVRPLCGNDAEAAATAYHALCEGLGALELRGAMRRHTAAETWQASLQLLVAGLDGRPH
jgi:AcrR family transcriptional regulator